MRVDLGDDVLFLYRTAERIFALSNRCTHVGGPLNQGRVQKLGPQLTVTCPVHGSIFRLDDGRVLRGPASRPAPVYETRVNGDAVEVRPPALESRKARPAASDRGQDRPATQNPAATQTTGPGRSPASTMAISTDTSRNVATPRCRPAGTRTGRGRRRRRHRRR